jgi:RhtB (resistance to homoserine/threonine) family protein
MDPSASPFLLLIGIAALHLVAVASPGPAFIMVTRASVVRSRVAGLATGVGVATAALLWALAATLGLNLVLEQAPWLYWLMQVLGGLYLLWIGIQSWRHAAAPLPAEGSHMPGTTTLFDFWLQGLTSSLANPKIIVFFGSIFVTLFTPGTPTWVWVAAVIIVPVNEILWYALVAFTFSTRPVQAFYRRAKAFIDRLMGSLMGFFGIRLLIGAFSRFAA